VASSTQPLPRYGTTGGSAIGVAVAPSPLGPWTDAGPPAGGGYETGPLLPPQHCTNSTSPTCYTTVIDPALFTDQDGSRYLYYGSFASGTWAQRVSADGLQTVGSAVAIGHADRYEGTYVVRHDVGGTAYYYDFSSGGNCCTGPNDGYSVVVNRSRSPLGPFVDEQGLPMLRPAPGSATSPTYTNLGGEGGGYPTLKANGNQWTGVGHNAMITDLSGQDWIVYHGVDEQNGWVNGLSPGAEITYRQLFIDPVEWTSHGWPVVNNGKGPSQGPQRAPATMPIVGDNFNAPSGCAAPGSGNDLTSAWRARSGTWGVPPGDCVSGGYAEQSSAGGGLLLSRGVAPPASRVECDARGTPGGAPFGCLIAAGGSTGGVAVLLDPQRRTLTTGLLDGGRIDDAQSTLLPAGFDVREWHHLVVEQTGLGAGGATYSFNVSEAGRDPLAEQDRTLPARDGTAGPIGFVSLGGTADFDNVSAVRYNPDLASPQTTPAVGPEIPSRSDEFAGPLGSQWSWVRENPSLTSLAGGKLTIQTNGDLYQGSNNAQDLLLETPPTGSYVIQTEMQFDPNQNYEQAGILVYSDDDHYLKIGPADVGTLTRVISGRETLQPLPSGVASCPSTPSATSNIAVTAYTHALCPNEGEAWDEPSNGSPTPNGATAQAPQVTTWLRVYVHGDVYTPYTSLDGTNWVKGQAWSLDPVSSAFPIRIGLYAFAGGASNSVPAEFDYLRVFDA
ncbi:MAG: family 43 glycosylhydrolase, partial [Candidatus Dormiibacterota bacterium]